MKSYFHIFGILLILVLSGGMSQNMAFSQDKGDEAMDKAEENKISGKQLMAFLAAHEAFIKDSGIPEEKRRLENYDVGFAQDKEKYTVFFFPKRKPNERLRPGGVTELGKEVSYTVSKADYKVIKRMFYR